MATATMAHGERRFGAAYTVRILVALGALGVLAGYDIGRESQISTAQVATTYPLASEATESSPAAASSEVGGAAEESSPEKVPLAREPEPPKP